MENEMGFAVGHLAPMEVKRNAYMIVVEKPEGQKTTWKIQAQTEGQY